MNIMELASVRIAKSPYGRGRVRLVGDVIYDDRRAKPEQYWFDVPEAYGDSLSVSGNPWLACLLPLAVTRGEPLRLCRPIDPVLSQNAARLMQIWVGWYPRLRIVPIEAEVKPVQAGTGPSETAAFFSGGVDSFFTVLRDRETRDRAAFPVIDRLLCVWEPDSSSEASTPARLAEDQTRPLARRQHGVWRCSPTRLNDGH
jgi:hypothetical protein